MDATSTYQKFARYYDLSVNGFTEDFAFYKAFCAPQEHILEVGCGTGRVLKSFLADGFRITGVDISQEMLDVAHAKLATFARQGRVTLLRHNFLEQPLTERYDKVLVTFYPFNYILENPMTFLQHILRSMAADAVLLMDLFYPQTFARKESENVWTSHALCAGDRTITLRDQRTCLNGLEKRVQIYEEQGGTTEITSVRKYYAPAAVKSLLETAGFEQIGFSASYDKHTFEATLNDAQLTRNFLAAAKKS